MFSHILRVARKPLLLKKSVARKSYKNTIVFSLNDMFREFFSHFITHFITLLHIIF